MGWYDVNSTGVLSTRLAVDASEVKGVIEGGEGGEGRGGEGGEGRGGEGGEGRGGEGRGWEGMGGRRGEHLLHDIGIFSPGDCDTFWCPLQVGQ